MRTVLIAVALSWMSGCTSGLSEYDACPAEEAGILACAVGCPGGGVGCDSQLTIAASCDGSRWYSIGGCGGCQAESAGAVNCDGIPRAVPLASCGFGFTACSMDGAMVLECIEGRFVAREMCEQGTQCGRGSDGLDCI